MASKRKLTSNLNQNTSFKRVKTVFLSFLAIILAILIIATNSLNLKNLYNLNVLASRSKQPVNRYINFTYNTKTKKIEATNTAVGSFTETFNNKNNLKTTSNQNTLEIQNIESGTLVYLANEKIVSDQFSSKGEVINSKVIDIGLVTGTIKVDSDKSINDVSFNIFGQEFNKNELIVNATENPETVYELYKNTAGRQDSEVYDILFIPVGYTDDKLSEYRNTIKSEAEVIPKTSFFRDHQDRFNIKRLDKTYSRDVLQCITTPYFSCLNTSYINQLKIQYGVDAIVFVFDDTSSNGTSHLGSGIVFITKTSINATVHELGHGLGMLDDEYVYSNLTNIRLPVDGINCKTSCSNFEAKYIPNGCFSGCTYGIEAYRSTDVSMMKNIYFPFNQLGFDTMANAIKFYSPEINYPSAAYILNPNPDTFIKSRDVIFNWSTGRYATSYNLVVSKSIGGNDLNCSYEGINLSYNCTNLNIRNGDNVYVRISTSNGQTTSYNDYKYSVNLDFDAAVLKMDGLFNGEIYAPYAFTWNNIPYADSYHLIIGTSPFANDLFDKSYSNPTTYAYFDYNQLITKFTGRKKIYITLITILGTSSKSTTKEIFLNVKDSSTNLNCDNNAVKKYITNLGLRPGQQTSLAAFNQIIKRVTVNYPFKNLSYFAENNTAQVFTNDFDVNKCFLLFRLINNNTIKYENIYKVWPVSVSTRISENKIYNYKGQYGAYIVVIENNKSNDKFSFTPYQVIY